MKVVIITSREVGKRCQEIAATLLPVGWVMADSIEEADVVISVMYNKLLVLDKRKRYYNFHPAILPEYAGAGGFSWAIINKENEVGVTLHEMSNGIDDGDIIGISKFPVEEGETAESLFDKGMVVMKSMFTHYFVKLLNNDFIAQKQDISRRGLYTRNMLDEVKDLTHIIRGLTFTGKESAYFFDSQGEKVYIEYK